MNTLTNILIIILLAVYATVELYLIINLHFLAALFLDGYVITILIAYEIMKEYETH